MVREDNKWEAARRRISDTRRRIERQRARQAEKRSQAKGVNWRFAPLGCAAIVFGIIGLNVDLGWDFIHGNQEAVIYFFASVLMISGVTYFLYKFFVRGVSEGVGAARKRPSMTAPPPVFSSPPPDDLKARLRNLEGLHKEGLLTDAEYQAKREEILGEV